MLPKLNQSGTPPLLELLWNNLSTSDHDVHAKELQIRKSYEYERVTSTKELQVWKRWKNCDNEIYFVWLHTIVLWKFRLNHSIFAEILHEFQKTCFSKRFWNPFHIYINLGNGRLCSKRHAEVRYIFIKRLT